MERRERIAVVLGIPITPEEFRARMARGPWDYGQRLVGGRSLVEAVGDYGPVWRVAADLLRRASAAGASVCRCATLADLADASQRHDVVVVVAHWRGADVTDDDLRDGWEACIERASADDPMALVKAELVGSGTITGGASGNRGSADDRRRAARALNRVVTSGVLRPFLPSSVATDFVTHDLILQTLSRDLLDLAFGGALRPGNQLELFDGLHSLAAVDGAIERDFAGVLDLSCCTSSVLGTYLGMRRAGVKTITGDHFIVPAPQLRLIEGVLELMNLDPSLGYAQARRTLAYQLGDHYRGARHRMS